jgi:hypothetical protein
VFFPPSPETQVDVLLANFQQSRDDVVELVGDPTSPGGSFSAGGSSPASPTTGTMAAELQEVGMALAGSPASIFAPPPPPLSSSSPTPPTLETGGVPSIAPSPTPFGVLVASSFGGVEDIGNDPCDGAKDPEGGATCASAGTVGDVGGSAAASVDSPQALATTWQRSVNHDRMILYYLLMTKEDWFRR